MYTHMHIKSYFKVLHLWVTVQLRKAETEVFNQLWACSNTQLKPFHTWSPMTAFSLTHFCVQTPKTTLFVFTHKEIIFALLPSKAHLLKSKGRHRSVLTREDISKTASESQQLRELDSDPLNPIRDIVQMWGRLEWKGKCTLCYLESPAELSCPGGAWAAPIILGSLWLCSVAVSPWQNFPGQVTQQDADPVVCRTIFRDPFQCSVAPGQGLNLSWQEQS